MDIRKWFTSVKGETKVTPDLGNDFASNKRIKDSKNLKNSPERNAKKSKKRRIIESDSDEDPIPKETEKERSVNKKTAAHKNLNISIANQEKKKEVSVSDFFGSSPISRPEKTKRNEKRVKEENTHEDDDFEATLLQLDTQKPIKVEDEPVKEPVKSSPVNGNNKASKLAASRKRSKPSPVAKVEIVPNSKKPSPKQVITEEKPTAKKHKGGGASYASYLGREGPRCLGSKEIPEGEEDCLAGLSFVITGVLESIERDEAKALIEKYGGKVMATLSKNTKYIVIGRDAGASKLEKVEKLGTKQLDEDGLFDLIRTMPGKSHNSKPKSQKKVATISPSKLKESTKSPLKPEATKSPSKPEATKSPSKLEATKSPSQPKESPKSPSKLKAIKSPSISKENTKSAPITKDHAAKDDIVQKASFVNKGMKEASISANGRSQSSKCLFPEQNPSDKLEIKSTLPVSCMWVDKYKPASMKQIIGQQGDKSNAKKLLQWLLNWRKNRKLNKKAFPGRFNVNDDGSGYKAALLSGPPGVGKTTTAQLVCQDAGFDFFELNASDTRSKKNLQQSVSQLLGNQTLADCFNVNSNAKVSSNHVIIMDEVDGMAGNEDRGGMAELIGLIKASKIPIICICNDRNHPKIRSLSNHCFDLRFQRPRVEQIKAAMMSIAFREHIKVSPEALNDIILASNQDIRQVLHNMSVWSAKSKGLSSEQTKIDIGRGVKHVKMGPFDVLREVFAIGNNPKATIMDKSDLFFHDYSLAPLFVQENYVHVLPSAAEGDRNKHLRLLSAAADSICIGDIIDRQIRNQNSWSLLPTQAIFASVVPGELLKGHLRQMIGFPIWFGKNSSRNHMDRVLQELHVHMRMRITGNKTDVALEYLPLLKRALTNPLISDEQGGIKEVLNIMEQYYLLREDFDSIIELSLWPNQTDPRTKISTKVKSAFTRAYNKESGKNPYAVTNVKKKKGSAANLDDDVLDEEKPDESGDEEDDSLENDAMIKVKKPTKKGATGTNEASTSKEKKKNTQKKGKTK